MRNNSITLCLSAIAFAMNVTAQTIHLTGVLSDGDATQMNLSAMPMDGSQKLTKLATDGKHFEGDMEQSSTCFYSIYGVLNGGQLVIPFFIPADTSSFSLDVDMTSGFPTVRNSGDNHALSSFNRLTRDKGIYLWQNAKVSGFLDVMPTFLKGYLASADSLVKQYKCTPSVIEYLHLWAYTTAYSNCQMLPRMTGTKAEAMPFKVSDVLPDPSTVLDTPLSSLFPMAAYIVASTLPKGNIEEKLGWLYDRYSCDSIRSKVKAAITENYVNSFNFADNYESGLDTLQRITEKYSLGSRYVDMFKQRKSSVGSVPFPANVKLTDINNDTVDFSTFKGYYVYIDLWASWCGPCVKEVPYLQSLEKELQNKSVKFVSISLDKNENAWRTKMKALNMHGYQLLNSDNSLADALNVSGIPRFVIYDKEGRLHDSNAPRPSDPSLKPLLESLK